MKVEIICPLFNAENYINALHASLLKQKGVDDYKISYVLTESSDNTSKKLSDLHVPYTIISKQSFSHSLTRETIAMDSSADIIVFITQDIVIRREDWLKNLIKDIDGEGIVASFSRQICTNNSLEKYTRESNYPNKSYVVSKNDISNLGLKTFFFSDASSAVYLPIFKKLGGYDKKDLPISEDMYFAYKVIMEGYSIKYCADSIVEHSHSFSYHELYDRYYLTGMFFRDNKYLDEFGTTDSGIKLSFYIFKRIIEDRNWKAAIQFLPNMLARYLGMRNGKRSKK